MQHTRVNNSTASALFRRPARTWVLAALVAGLALRLFFIFRFGAIPYDTKVYGELARNAMEHGVYGFTNQPDNGAFVAPTATLIRLPGYPIFLGLCFLIFGMENYTAVVVVQALFDLWTCLLVAALATRLVGSRVGLIALWLAVLCPFTANYVAAPLTETLTLWSIALAFYALVRWRDAGAGTNRWLYVVAVGLAYGILLRPEQGLLAATVVPAMLWLGAQQHGVRALRSVALVSAVTLLPLVPWTARNWSTFHVFEPLAPRQANDPGEFVSFGFQRWYRTWGVEFVSTQDIYWKYDGQPLDIGDLPNRAFDSQAQYEATDSLFADYNEDNTGTPALDARFDEIARERIAADPLRYYVVMPVGRVLDMMFRPRTETLPLTARWWEFRPGDRMQDAMAAALGLINLAYFFAAGVGMVRRRVWVRQQPILWSMLAFVALRTALLLTIDNSEPRYTLEFFPVLFVFAALSLSPTDEANPGAP